MRKIAVHQESHIVAARQAKSFALVARRIGYGLSVYEPDHAESLSLLTNAALAIELYLKAILLATSRAGSNLATHDLDALYEALAEREQLALEEQYAAYEMPIAPEPRIVMGLAPGSAARPSPPISDALRTSYETFWDAMLSLSRVFIRARYFFESLRPDAWSLIELPRVEVYRALTALDAVYEDHIDRTYGRKPTKPRRY